MTGISPYLRSISTESFATSGVLSLLYSLFPSFSMVAPHALIIPVNGTSSRYRDTNARLLPVQSHARCPLATSFLIDSTALSGTPFSISQIVPSASKKTAFLSLIVLSFFSTLYGNLLCKKFPCHPDQIFSVFYACGLIRRMHGKLWKSDIYCIHGNLCIGNIA